MFDVTVVIPNYNGGRFLPEAINSALGQEGVSVEVIVVDDGSTDSSRQILERYGNRIHVFHHENRGAPFARNIGWKNATAHYIKFLDSDDVLLPGALRAQHEKIARLSETQVPYGPAIWVDEYLHPATSYPVRPIEPEEDPVHHILLQNPLTSSPLHRRKLLEKVNGFDEELIKGQEFDLHLRMVLNGTSFVYYPSSVYYFRQHDSSGRFSNAGLSQNKTRLYKMLQKQYDLINQYYSYKTPGLINDIMAKRFWLTGRAILQETNLESAMPFFEFAERLSYKTMDSRLLYRALKTFFGGVRTEVLLKSLKGSVKQRLSVSN